MELLFLSLAIKWLFVVMIPLTNPPRHEFQELHRIGNCTKGFYNQPMAKKQNSPQKYQIWIEAKRKYHLSDTQIQMARELGLNPKKFGGLANTRQEPWKMPLPEFIEELYFKRFGKKQPEIVKQLDQERKSD